MAKQATAKASTARTTRTARPTKIDRSMALLRKGISERVLVMRMACEAKGTTFDAWYSDCDETNEDYDGAGVLKHPLAREAWRQLRTFAEAFELTIGELLIGVGLDFNADGKR